MTGRRGLRRNHSQRTVSPAWTVMTAGLKVRAAAPDESWPTLTTIVAALAGPG